MSQALHCLGLKTGLKNGALKIYVNLSKRHDIWALPLSEIKRMKCDISSPLFHFKKCFKSYWILIQRRNAIQGIRFGTIYTYTPWRVGFSWMTPFRGAKFDDQCLLRHLGANLKVCVCTRVGSTFIIPLSKLDATSKVPLTLDDTLPC